jgi:hypothetical protein
MHKLGYIFLIIQTLSSWCFSAWTAQNSSPLKKLAVQHRFLLNNQKENALLWAKQKGLSIRHLTENGRFSELVRMDGVRPLYISTHNLNAAKTINLPPLWPGASVDCQVDGRELSWGQLAMWDGGSVLATHVEFMNSGSSRVRVMDDNAMPATHATHVAGTLLSAGVAPQAHGMAAAACLYSFDWWNDYAEMAEAASNGLLLSNHSYGWLCGWVDQWWFDENKDDKQQAEETKWCWFGDPEISDQEDYLLGYYSIDALIADELACWAPYYLIVKSAGNERYRDNAGPAPGETYWQYNYHPESGPVYTLQTKSPASPPADCNGDLTYDGVEGLGVAKNVLTVGAIQDLEQGLHSYLDVAMTDFSSWGPTDDGRIKPDVVANGVALYSTSAAGTDQYATFSGTSMAAPSVTGALALLQELYHRMQQNYMRSATLKALVIHNADEAGQSAGPDYRFGWGLVNASHCSRTILEDAVKPMVIQENRLDNHGVVKYLVNAGGNEPLKITLVWTDPAGVMTEPVLDSPKPMLVNDLDLRVLRMDNNREFYPWILDPQHPDLAAACGDNSVDNVEQINIDDPGQASYTVVIRHKGDLQNENPQAYSLIITGAGEIMLPVELCRMSAQWAARGVTLAWSTASESENLGFQIYRSESANQPLTPISAQLLAGAGTSSSVHHYEYLDETAHAGHTYYYQIADVDYQGHMRFHEILKIDAALATDFNLEQNYPNPFYLATQIRFSLKQQSDVHMLIYNLSGEAVKNLSAANLFPGLHQITWDGKDDQGKALPSGIYFCTMKAADYQAVKKMQLIH